MNFHNHQTVYQCSAREESPDQFYANMAAEIQKIDHPKERTCLEMALSLEASWYSGLRPYYKVWPSICDCLTTLKLDIPGASLALGGHVFTCCLRFPIDNEPVVDRESVGSLLYSYCPPIAGKRAAVRFYPMCVGREKHPFSFFELTSANVEETVEQLEEAEFLTAGQRERCSTAMFSWCARIGVTVLMLRNDPSVITPEVLAKDRRKYDETKDPKYVAKAKRRGIVGWRLGESYESCPHIRRPHFGLRWTGKGKTIPRIVPVRGSVVHRKKLTDVPTGYLTPEGIEVEP